MAKRYVTRSAWSSDLECEVPGVDCLSHTVHEEDRRPVRTGLLDHHGNDIYALDEAEPIGFIRFSVE